MAKILPDKFFFFSFFLNEVFSLNDVGLSYEFERGHDLRGDVLPASRVLRELGPDGGLADALLELALEVHELEVPHLVALRQDRCCEGTEIIATREYMYRFLQ